jgi:hypothetical protein
MLDLILSFAGALALGAALSAASAGNFLTGWLAFSLIGWACLFLLLRVWRTLGGGKTLSILITVTLMLRLAVAVFAAVGLPAWGYDNPVNKGGALYSDAYDRDHSAFKLAETSAPLLKALTAPDTTDQYGGLRFISAAIYRYLSPDAERPLLISLLAAFMMALGVAFFWSGVQKRWSLKIATLAAWILAIFPDGVLLGSSQMREPFLIGLVCIAFWAILDWQQSPLRAALVTLSALALSSVISLPAGGIFAFLLVAMLVLEWALAQHQPTKRWLGLIVFSVICLAAMAFGWLWLRTTLYYDSFTTTQESGWFQEFMRHLDSRYMIPFTTAYGLIQPLLPAALTDSANWIWKTIAILRALGWYASLPFLFFSFFTAFKAKRADSKWLLIFFNLAFLVWVIVSSARAGGDLWDNPRYRYMLLPFMCVLIAWAFEHYRETHSPWLWRWTAIVVFFVLLFTNLYINRQVATFTRLSYQKTIILILIFALVIVAEGLIYDHWFSKRKGE